MAPALRAREVDLPELRLAQQYGGRCNLRFDDTNPEKEEQEYVDSIKEGVKWLGFDWGEKDLYASDYFERLYEFAEALIGRPRLRRQPERGGDPREPRDAHRVRARLAVAQARRRGKPRALRGMRADKFKDGTHVLRAKIDMRSPNINLRDPVMYRIRHASPHRRQVVHLPNL